MAWREREEIIMYSWPSFKYEIDFLLPVINFTSAFTIATFHRNSQCFCKFDQYCRVSRYDKAFILMLDEYLPKKKRRINKTQAFDEDKRNHGTLKSSFFLAHFMRVMKLSTYLPKLKVQHMIRYLICENLQSWEK